MSAVPIISADEALERDIRREYDAFMAAQHAKDREQASAHWREMVRLIGQRSPRQVKRMEAERNLA